MRAAIAWIAAPLLLLGVGCGAPPPADFEPETPRTGDSPLRVDGRIWNFLVRDGAGTAAKGDAYYASIIENFRPGIFTLDAWKAAFIGANPVAKSLYRNNNELDLVREMTCSQTIDRGVGGCMVTNHGDFGDPDSKGTVTMNVSPEGFTRFYVFNPDGVLSPTAVLDSEGEKFVPQLCTTCHAGGYDGTKPELGSIFREFEPSLLENKPGTSAEVAEQEYFDLNQAIAGANRAVRTQEEGAPPGTNHAKQAMEAYVAEMYAPGSKVARAVDDPAHLPVSWTTGATPELATAKTGLWNNVVSRYCMSCHRTNTLDFSNYQRYQFLGTKIAGRPLLHSYLDPNPADEAREQFPFMPQAKRTFENFHADPAAKSALEAWEQAL